jgi:hypothetical protein
MNNKKNTHLSRKILYAIVITMSGLILLLNVGGIIGVWAVGRPLSNVAVSALKVVETSAKGIQTYTARVDEPLATLQAKVTEITDATQQISANVSDKGLVKVLLPEAQEQQIAQQASSVRDTFNGIKETLSTGLDMYRSIDEIPFISLPALSKDQINQIEKSVDQTQSQAETLRSAIADFRSGVTDKIDKVESTANGLNEEIQHVRNEVAQIDSNMAELEARSVAMQRNIIGIITAISVILSLIFAFVIWTQVEMIRQYVAHWHLLGQEEKPALPADEPASKK